MLTQEQEIQVREMMEARVRALLQMLMEAAAEVAIAGEPENDQTSVSRQELYGILNGTRMQV